jgi:DNA-binding SARP family transcriptional activator
MKSDSYFDTSFYYHLASWNDLLQGDIPLALTNQEKALADSVRCGSPFPDANYHFGMAQILHERREYKKSEFHLNCARQVGRQMKSALLEYMCLLSAAQFALDRGRKTLCLKELQKAMTLGREKGYVNFVYWRPTVMARLCMKAIESGIEIGYAQDLIRRRNLTPDTIPINIANWAWAIKIHTLGRFELERDGKTIQFKRKVQKMPLSMLKAIIAHGGKEVGEEQLIDDLWPDADGDMAHQSFKVTLHRLRQLIGSERAIHFSEGMVTLDPRYCWVDTWAFEYLSEKINTLIKEANKNSNKFNQLMEKILTIYRGSFMGKDQVEIHWANPLRERLHNKFIRNIINICGYYEQKRQYNKAIEYYQKGLEASEITEEFYQGIMYCYQRLNRGSDAVSVYNRCKSLLSTVLSINPSPKTEALYQEIIRSNPAHNPLRRGSS